MYLWYKEYEWRQDSTTVTKWLSRVSPVWNYNYKILLLIETYFIFHVFLNIFGFYKISIGSFHQVPVVCL